MPKFRKKPVEIEARWLPTPTSSSADTRQFEAAEEIASWCGGYIYGGVESLSAAIKIPTLEGEMLANPGDWIIQGVQGEFYPCKPDIFEATYEEVK